MSDKQLKKNGILSKDDLKNPEFFKALSCPNGTVSLSFGPVQIMLDGEAIDALRDELSYLKEKSKNIFTLPSENTSKSAFDAFFFYRILRE